MARALLANAPPLAAVTRDAGDDFSDRREPSEAQRQSFQVSNKRFTFPMKRPRLAGVASFMS
jgi:hypothetical protein